MLLVRIIENNEIDAYFRVRLGQVKFSVAPQSYERDFWFIFFIANNYQVFKNMPKNDIIHTKI